MQFNQFSQHLSPKHCYSPLHGFRYLEQTWLAQLPTYRCLQIKPSLCINNVCLPQTTPLIRFRSHTPSAWATIQIVCKFTLNPHLWWPQNLNLWAWRLNDSKLDLRWKKWRNQICRGAVFQATSWCADRKRRGSPWNTSSAFQLSLQSLWEGPLIQYSCTVTSEMSYMVSIKSSPSLAWLGLPDNWYCTSGGARSGLDYIKLLLEECMKLKLIILSIIALNLQHI